LSRAFPFLFFSEFKKEVIREKEKVFLMKSISKTKKEKTNMQTQTAVQDEKQEIVVLADVPRSENDIYRISRKHYKGNRYLDLRIFFKAKDDTATLVPCLKGVCFAEKFREDIIAGLIMARTIPQPVIPEGKTIASVTVCDISVSETEIFRISKGCGKKTVFVDIRKFFASKDGAFIPFKTKGVSIQETALEEVILGLVQSGPKHSA